VPTLRVFVEKMWRDNLGPKRSIKSKEWGKSDWSTGMVNVSITLECGHVYAIKVGTGQKFHTKYACGRCLGEQINANGGE
jgi:hypothetical protein